MQELIYGTWSTAYKEIVQEFKPVELRKLHSQRRPYQLAVGKKNHPYCFIVVNNDVFIVSFLDSLKRMYLSYSFFEKAPGKLFLFKASYYEYEGESDDFYKMTEYSFLVDGTAEIRVWNYKTNTRDVQKLVDTVDVSTHWEDYPEFGQYDRLIIKERGL